MQLEEGLKGLSNFERRMHGLDLAATVRYASVCKLGAWLEACPRSM